MQTLDPDHLAAQTGGDAALQREILTLFAEQSVQILSAVEAGGAAAEGSADLVHKLKGSARAIGANRVAAVAEQLEALLRAGKRGDGLLPALRAAIEMTRTSIQSHLDTLA